MTVLSQGQRPLAPGSVSHLPWNKLICPDESYCHPTPTVSGSMSVRCICFLCKLKSLQTTPHSTKLISRVLADAPLTEINTRAKSLYSRNSCLGDSLLNGRRLLLFRIKSVKILLNPESWRVFQNTLRYKTSSRYRCLVFLVTYENRL